MNTSFQQCMYDLNMGKTALSMNLQISSNRKSTYTAKRHYLISLPHACVGWHHILHHFFQASLFRKHPLFLSHSPDAWQSCVFYLTSEVPVVCKVH